MHDVKAQIQSIFLKVFLTVLIFLIVFSFLTNSIDGIKNNKCKGEYIKFVDEFVSEKNNLDFGEQIKQEFIMPCNSDKIFFVDSAVDRPLLALEDYPFLNNELRENTANVFFYRKGNLQNSILMDGLDINFPYYRCFESRSNVFSITFENGIKTDLFGLKDDSDCGIESVRSINLQKKDLSDLLEDIKSIAIQYQGLDSSDVIGSDCNVTRNFIIEGNITNINIAKAKDCNVLLFEKIPKCAIQSLKLAMDKGEIIFEDNLSFNILDDDPLMVWHFDDSKEEILYSIKRFIDENCKDQFISVAFDYDIQNQRTQNEIENLIEFSDKSIVNSIDYVRQSPFKSCFECMDQFNKLLYLYKTYKDSGDYLENDVENIRGIIKNRIDRLDVQSQEKNRLKNELDIIHAYMIQ